MAPKLSKLAYRDRILVSSAALPLPQWRERHILEYVGTKSEGQFQGQWYIIATMDGNLQSLNFTTLTAMRKLEKPPRQLPAVGQGGDLPPGVFRQACDVEEDYDDQFTEQQYSDMRLEAVDMGEGERYRMDIEEPDDRDIDAGFLARRGPLILPAQWTMVTCESVGGVAAGTEIEQSEDEHEVGIGVQGYRMVGKEVQRFIVCKRDELEETITKCKDSTAGDPRIFPLVNLPVTETRGRTWADFFQNSQKEELKGLPLDGPRVMPEILLKLNAMGYTPTQWSLFWRRNIVKLEPSNPIAEAHYEAAEAIEDSGCWDQLDLNNLVVGEHLGRTWVLAEYQENKRLDALEASQSNASGSVSTLEKQLARGNRSSRAHTVVPASFSTWMTSELKTEADRAKGARKHREELRLEAERSKVSGSGTEPRKNR